MSTIAQARIIKIGSFPGIRIPKWLLDQTGLSGEVEVEARDDQLIIRPAKRKAREGWDKAFQEMAARGDDQLLDPPMATEWDGAEWEWGSNRSALAEMFAE